MIDDLSNAEKAILILFAERKSKGHAFLRCADIYTIHTFTRIDLDRAMDRLVERGWMFRGGNLHDQDNEHCLLFGNGLIMAQQLWEQSTRPCLD